MRKSLFALPVLMAGLAIACGSSGNHSGFATDTNKTDPADGGDAGNKGSQGFDTDGTEDYSDEKDGGCSSSATTITRTPVVLEFVVDESGSMSGAKWTAQRDALLAAFDDMNTQADPALFVGLELFSDQPNATVEPKPLTDPKQYGRLTKAIDKDSPKGTGTGTKKALDFAYTEVDGFSPPPSGGFDTTSIKRIVVLMSDGVPSGQETEQADCEQMATDEFNQVPPAGPVLTFAIGVGKFGGDPGYDPAFMGRMSVAGGTPLTPGCDPASTDLANVCHFQVTPGDDPAALKDAFIAAINAVRASAATCEFKFSISKGADPNNVKVKITGADGKSHTIKKDPDNGWSFDDPSHPTKVILNGAACAASNGTVSGRVDVVLGCASAQ